MRKPAGAMTVGCLLGMAAAPAWAHDLGALHLADRQATYDRSIRPPIRQSLGRGWAVDALIQADQNRRAIVLANAETPQSNPLSRAVESMLALFKPFSPQVRTRWDERFLYVESDAMPDHRMMVGITAWQQQVPLPQPYVGENAWRIPLHPVPARQPLSARTSFFRGAIALAVNGVPIFNPIKNDGRTDTFLAGELDEFGGHAGRADDYHYHIAPLHLQKVVGAGKPVAFALDGYPIHGLAEPDGTAVGRLDALNGHLHGGSYHYHASKAYPYVNGGFYGQITEREGQVDPQPRAASWRAAQQPLRGAKVTAFTKDAMGDFVLQFTLDQENWTIKYGPAADKSYRFTHIDPDGLFETFNYRANTGRRPGMGNR